MPHELIRVSSQRLADVCRRHHIQRLSLFGSVLRDDFKPDSDIDVLVEFEAGVSVGYFTIGRIINELSDLFGRRVDVRTPLDLEPSIRSCVLADAEVRFAA
jgi:predicted nucleotidyltransferase